MPTIPRRSIRIGWVDAFPGLIKRRLRVSQTLSYGMMDRSYSQYYRHSGKVTIHGLLVAAIVGLPAAVLLGIAYGYADIYCPIIYLNILLTLGFGAGIAWICGRIMMW